MTNPSKGSWPEFLEDRVTVSCDKRGMEEQVRGRKLRSSYRHAECQVPSSHLCSKYEVEGTGWTGEEWSAVPSAADSSGRMGQRTGHWVQFGMAGERNESPQI